DHHMYLEKYRTCARAREFGKQVLGMEFYRKEHTKPLFSKHKILAFKNVYTYQLCLDMFKLLTNEAPTKLHDLVTRSHRNNCNLLIVPKLPRNSFVYRGTFAWNIASKALVYDKTFDEIKPGYLKSVLRSNLLELQKKHDINEWIPHNFKLSSISKL
ncbi:MAG: hypothetical protein GY820_19740, partial [Gammaproteobacteria bacterium]|nr:hypothetical protein [Gammaproteobacteria bacterium]